MKSSRLFALLLLFSALVLTGCAKYEYLQSEKKVKGLLKGTWELVRIPLKDENGNELPRQRWIFTDDRIYRQRMDSGVFVDIENATYTVDTKLMKVLFYTHGFAPANELDADWTVVQLDANYLIIATDYYDTKGVYELEFTRVP